MGIIQHHALVVTSGSKECTEEAYRVAEEIFSHDESMSSLLSPLNPSPSNGYYSFVVFPDGSKEGWRRSDEGDHRREELKRWLRNQWTRSCLFDWVEVAYGGEIDNFISDSDDVDEDWPIHPLTQSLYEDE